MEKVFVITRYQADEAHTEDRNDARAKTACMFVLQDGCAPVCPRLFYSRDFTGDYDMSSAYRNAVRALIRDCDTVRQYGASVDPMMKAELDIARDLGKPIQVFNSIGIPYEQWNSVKFAGDPSYQAACEHAGRPL